MSVFETSHLIAPHCAPRGDAALDRAPCGWLATAGNSWAAAMLPHIPSVVHLAILTP